MSGNIQENSFWSKVNEIVEKCSGERVPKCIEQILSCCGYNHPLSFEKFSNESLSQVEDHMRKSPQNTIKRFDCTLHGCLIAHYKDQKLFKLLPGHRILITSIVKCIDQYHQKISQENSHAVLCEIIKKHAYLSVVMKELIQGAMKNEQLSKNQAQYSDITRHFATYVFILCGRSCYEVLNKNLPFPSTSTVCMYMFHEI